MGCCTSLAQNSSTGFWESQLAINHKVSDNYKVNFATKSRSYVYRDDAFELKVRQLEFVHFSTYLFNSNHSISGGVMYRFRETFDDKSNELRLTQQYNYAYRPQLIRFGHRFRTEQRIQETLTIHRFRYRFAMDMPLQGEKLDVGESYWVNTTEFLWSIAPKTKSQLDHRITSQIGWLFAPKFKFQTGLEYRSENFNIKNKASVFLLTSIILTI